MEFQEPLIIEVFMTLFLIVCEAYYVSDRLYQYVIA